MRTAARVQSVRLASALVFGLTAISCGGSVRPTSNEAHLIVAYPAGLTDVGLDGTVHDVIVAATETRTPASPAASPDGRSIAYLQTPTPFASDSGADLWVADRNGQRARVLVRHPQRDHSVRAPTWEDDTHVLVVIDRPGTCDGCNPATTSEQELDRVDVDTGTTIPVRRNVTAFDVSPDRDSLVYPDIRSERAAALVIARFPDGEARVVVPIARGFAEITSPRFSPDGSRVAFAAADGRNAGTNDRRVSHAPGPSESANFDGLPESLWVVDASGQNLRLVANLREDVPVLVWSPAGATLFVIGTAALYRIDIETGEVGRLGAGAVHSQLAYVPPSHGS